MFGCYERLGTRGLMKIIGITGSPNKMLEYGITYESTKKLLLGT